MSDINYLMDRLAIQDTLVRYAHALDARKTELFDQTFSEDAVADYSDAGGIRGNFRELRDWLAESMSRFDDWQHLLSNFVIEIDGDTAHTRTDCYNPLLGHDAQGEFVVHVGCYYQDRLRRTADGWRIVERKLTMVWMDGPAERVGYTPA